mmetsp:Transcript_1527/g.5240  ORF Transcript_1527/g.5240 Transcript_1527/m.5240 type:complete len:495 (+) Transcript_1527:2498-3982(+)
MDTYSNPLTDRYASPEMSYIFSDMHKFSTWRELWYVLAEAEREIGINEAQKQSDAHTEIISENALQSMKQHLKITPEALENARQYEIKFKHDVMAHVHAFGDDCGNQAKKIIHLGATSCFVGDNTDLIQIKQASELVRKRMLGVIKLMREFAMQQRNVPCLGFTHFQPAQLTTVGKRCTLWLQDMLYDFETLQFTLHQVEKSFRGVKGTTGTQASFMELFEGDEQKVKQLDALVARKMGFKKSISVTGQTYTRKIDSMVLNTLSLIAQSAHKMCVDLRLLANLREIEEPFASHQIGSSAMAFKRNPMRCERVCALSRFVICNSQNAAHTHSNQWMERTLDDSANRRLSIAQSFLAVDAILKLMSNITNGLQVYPKVIMQHCLNELPFMITEKILMECVQMGADRQEVHELIRQHSMKAIEQVKIFGKENDLVKRLKEDQAFAKIHNRIDDMIDPRKFVGRAPQQVVDFVSNDVDPVLKEYEHLIDSEKAEELAV